MPPTATVTSPPIPASKQAATAGASVTVRMTGSSIGARRSSREQEIAVAVAAAAGRVGAVGQDDRPALDRRGPARSPRGSGVFGHTERLAPLPDEPAQLVRDRLAEAPDRRRSWRRRSSRCPAGPSTAASRGPSRRGRPAGARARAPEPGPRPSGRSSCRGAPTRRSSGSCASRRPGRSRRPSRGRGGASPARRSRSSRCAGRSGSRAGRRRRRPSPPCRDRACRRSRRSGRRGRRPPGRLLMMSASVSSIETVAIAPWRTSITPSIRSTLSRAPARILSRTVS